MRKTQRVLLAATAVAMTAVTTLSPTVGATGGRDAKGRILSNSKPSGPPANFEVPTDAVKLPDNAIFTIVFIGSDARPNEKMDRTRSDSMHVFTWNPKTQRGALLGIPRDMWVTLPGGKKGKINAALGKGGAEGVVTSIRNLTGIPVTKYVLTGFEGFTTMVDELGGVNIQVVPMNDRASGAQFAGGWYAFNGNAALAYSRNRKDVKNGDFTRSENQGRMLLALLAKLRVETSRPAELGRWITVLQENAKTNLTAKDLLDLSLIARQIDPAAISNLVIPSKAGRVGAASVVLATPSPLLAKLKTTGAP
jgi:polyisoprenyl-teichoic acid--peptidoglycan teichoic acid transferase